MKGTVSSPLSVCERSREPVSESAQYLLIQFLQFRHILFRRNASDKKLLKLV